MKRFSFAQMPVVVQATSMAALFMAWVMIEEFEIDRHHLDRFLPLYRVGNLCLYDLAAAVLIAAFWIGLRRNQTSRPAVSVGER